MKTFRIPVFWTVGADMEIQAETLKDAITKAYDMDIPKNGEYIDDSFNVDRDLAEEFSDQDHGVEGAL